MSRCWPVAVFAFVLCGGLVLCTGCGENDDAESNDEPIADDTGADDDAVEPPEWWRTVVFMEIFVRSYLDSNGDGIGDFPGLTLKLDYLADLGIGGLWLMPIYPTPFLDSGYDVADYEAINPEYGTLDDFQTFLDEAHARGIRVFIDGVFNHTSSEHEWFIESRSSRDNPKRDWYVWADEPLFDCGSSGLEFQGDNWEFDESTGQYYFHYFGVGQPDLNLDNPEVKEAIKDVVRFWFDRGVDGFRLDVPTSYYNDSVYCDHHPKTHEYLKELRAVADEYEGKAFVGETSGDFDNWLKYYGNGTDELHMNFNFNLTYANYATDYLSLSLPTSLILDATYARLPDGAQQAVFNQNHDFFRYYDMFFRNDSRCKALASLLLTLPGTPFLYYGEEIGMANGYEWRIDHRDAARTPMHWDESADAGFTTGEPWIAMAPNWKTNNVADEAESEDSLFNHFRKMIRIRNASPALNSGGYMAANVDSNEAAVFFRTANTQSALVAINFSPNPLVANVDLRLSPFKAAAGPVTNLFTGNAVSPISESNLSSYPVHVPAFGVTILVPNTSNP